MSYLRVRLDPDGYPLTPVIVRPYPRAQVRSDPVPMPEVQVTALFDTGANRSGVSPDVAEALGIFPAAAAGLDRVGVTGASIPIYPVRIVIPATEGIFSPFDGGAGGVRPSTPGADVIIGNDILKKFTFTYRGPLNDFLLSAEDDVVASVGRSEVQGLGTTPAAPA
jgi:hypothetical protein